MAVAWVVVLATIALLVGAGAGTLMTAVLIAAGRGQGEVARATCPTCSSPADPAPGREPSVRAGR